MITKRNLQWSMQRLDVIPFDMSSELENNMLKCYILCSFNNKNTLLQGHLTSKCEVLYKVKKKKKKNNFFI